MYMSKKCPFSGKKCIKDECSLWAEMTVKDLKTGELKRADDCVFAKIPHLLLELLRSQDGTQAAVESGRNESVKRQDALLELMTHAAKLSAIKQLKERKNEI